MKPAPRPLGSPLLHNSMATLYDVAHFVAWNGYHRDMQPYLGVDKAAWTNHEFMFPYTVRMKYGKHEETRLHMICYNYSKTGIDRLKRVKKLLEYGAKPDVTDKHGWTPLMCCASNVGRESLEIIKILLDAGADINCQSEYGYSPLHIAAMNGHIDVIKELIKRGANLEACDKDGWTALTRAAEEGHTNICKLLIASGADISYACRGYVSKNVNTIKYLRSIGCEMPDLAVDAAVVAKKRTIIPTLVKCGANPNIGHPMTPLEYASMGDNYCINTVKTLLKCGADPNIHSDPGWKSMDDAIYYKHYEIVKNLAEAGADLSIQNVWGYTPIHTIIRDSSEDGLDIQVAKDLLKYVKDFSILDNRGQTILEAAERFPELHAEILKAQDKSSLD